jgi:hypothetical protein
MNASTRSNSTHPITFRKRLGRTERYGTGHGGEELRIQVTAKKSPDGWDAQGDALFLAHYSFALPMGVSHHKHLHAARDGCADGPIARRSIIFGAPASFVNCILLSFSLLP